MFAAKLDTQLLSTPEWPTFKPQIQLKWHFTCRGVEIIRPDLHLGAFGGVVVSFPGPPVHAVSVRRVMAVVEQAVQVGLVALVVPPAALEFLAAVLLLRSVVVSVFGAEGLRIVHRQ